MIHTTQNNVSTNTLLSSLTLGRYRIAARPRALPGGRFAAQVHIASGQGSASTARVMRFVDDFATHDDAARYAQAEGLSWAAARQQVPAPATDLPQPMPAVQAILI